MKQIINIFAACGLFLLIYGCAQQVRPTGGPKDQQPPKILHTSPENFSTDFHGNKIVLEFDEFIRQNQLLSELIVSPSLENAPEIKIRGKKLELAFKDSLKSNTTYSLQFGKGIVDITEGNSLDSNVFVFSTGSFLDSLTLKGRVKDAHSLQPQKDVLVMLYNNHSDSIPYKEKPYYFTRTDEDGNYALNYMQPGNYKIFSLKDNNANYLFDQADEPIAFVDFLINPFEVDSMDLFLFTEKFEKQYISNTSFTPPGKITFVFNQAVSKASAAPVNDSVEFFATEFKPESDTLICWLTKEPKEDTLSFYMHIDDLPFDTVDVSLKTLGGGNKLRGKKQATVTELQLGLNLSKEKTLAPFKRLNITANRPVVKIDTAAIQLTTDSLPVPFFIKNEALHPRIFQIHFIPKEKQKYELLVPSKAFEDIYARTNDTLKAKFQTNSITDYGSVQFELAGTDSTHNYILQLFKGEKLYTEQVIASGSAVVFSNLPVGKYKPKLIYDKNNSGKWETGDYLQKQQPEKIIFHPEEIEIRANWELEIKWELL